MRRAIALTVAAAGLATILWAQHGPIRQSMQDDLTARSEQALAEAGLSDVAVTFAGRDGTVQADSVSQGEQAVAVVSALEGVRAVVAEVPTVAAVAPAPSPTPSPSPTPEPSPTTEPEEVQEQLIELPPVTFLDASATLTSAGRRALNRAAKILVDNPAVRIRIEGHTDSNGSAASNLALSKARAEAVRDYLRDRGVAADRMTARGYGESRLKVPDTTERNQAINRRVEFVVLD